MSMSGIKVNEKVLHFYNNDFKIKKLKAYFTCVIGVGEEGEEINMEDVTDIDPLPPNCTQDQNKEVFEKATATFCDEQPKFFIFDFHFKTKDGRDVDQIASISWISDNAPIKIKMKYAATKEVLKLPGAKAFQVSDKDDLKDYNQFIVELQKLK